MGNSLHTPSGRTAYPSGKPACEGADQNRTGVCVVRTSHTRNRLDGAGAFRALTLRAAFAALPVLLVLSFVGSVGAVPWRLKAARDARVQAWQCQDSLGLRRAAYPPVRWRLPLEARRLSTLRYWRYQRRVCVRVRHASPAWVICQVFGPYCAQAIRVARCESELKTWARNGQFLGLFQMGDYARSRYGHGWDAWTQARAAYRYFVDSGRDWSPWECRP